ncbi:MAG: hypothetical protein ACM3PY_09635, partial [Omnitrophica WOR_2 bacterium]
VVDFVFLVEYLLRRGLRPLAILLDPASFGGSLGSDYLSERVRTLGVPVRQVKNGSNLEVVLSEGYQEKI